MKSAPQYVKEYFEARPEFGREWPVSQVPHIRAKVTMEDALDWVDSTLTRAFKSAHGGNADRRADGTVYIDPVDVPTLDGFLTKYLQPQLRRAGADIRRAWARTCEWVEAHPDAGITALDLWKQAGGPEWGIAA